MESKNLMTDDDANDALGFTLWFIISLESFDFSYKCSSALITMNLVD